MVTEKKKCIAPRKINRKKKRLKIKKKNSCAFKPKEPEVCIAEDASYTVAKNRKPLSAYQQKLFENLKGSRFRSLNEEFYTQTSHVMKKKLQKDRAAFLEV
jgi:hypothetical protein